MRAGREIGDQAADLPQDPLATLGGKPHPLWRRIITPSEKRIRTLIRALDAAAHPAPETSDYVFYSIAPGRPINQSTVYLRFRGYLADAGIPYFTGGPHPHWLRHGFGVAALWRCAAEGADLAVVPPYLACNMVHADLRGSQ